MPDRVLEELAGAVADGEAVDWDYVSATVPPVVAGHFRSIWRVRLQSADGSSLTGDESVRVESPARAGIPLWLQGLVVLAASQVLVAFAAAITMPPDGQAIPPMPVLVNMAAFAVSGLVLLNGGRQDRRAVYLGGFFFAVAGALAPRFLRLLGPMPGALRWWTTAYVDAFAPILLWLFVRDFPKLGHFTRFDRVARWAVMVSACVSAALFGANIARTVAPGLLGPPLAPLSRNDRPSAYWLLSFALLLPALPVAIGRTRIAVGSERRRVRLFALGLFLGGAPMLLEVLIGMIFPASRARLARPEAMAATAFVLYGFLSIVPAVSAYSVLVQKVLTVRLFIARALQYALARYTLMSLAVLPVAGFLAYLLRHRQERLGDLLTSRTALLAAAAAAASLLLLRVRQPLSSALDRAFLRVDASPQDALASFGSRVGRAESNGEIVELLATHVMRTLGVEHVYLLSLQGRSDAFVPLHGVCRPLRRHTGLGVVVLESTNPVNVDRLDKRSIFHLLPEDDRRWVVDTAASLVQPIHGRNGTFTCLLVVGPRRIEREFSRADLLFLSSVTAAAALALENVNIREAGSTNARIDQRQSDETIAAECSRCGLVQDWAHQACTACGGALGPAAVPTTLLSKFRIVSVLGRGGMGVVYRATDVVLGRTVAVKTLPRLSEGAATRLRQEARAMATVTHPNLALIYGAETWRNTPFLVVEYLEGGTLASRLEQGPLPVGEALELCATLADVLDRIHAAGILHRDLKPSNIGFAADGTPKLLDFGLARLLDDAAPLPMSADVVVSTQSDGIAPTRSHGRSYLVGTPLYLSPEAIDGQSPDPSFDLWSLGVVLYEALSGRRPFNGVSVSGIFQAIRTANRRAVEGGLTGCPRGVAQYVCDMLSPDRSSRPASAGAVAARLRALRVELGA